MRDSGGVIPVLGVMGWSGAGKTTLLEQIIPDLRRHGLVGIGYQTHPS